MTATPSPSSSSAPAHGGAAAAREAARQADGKFGTQVLAEADPDAVALTDPAQATDFTDRFGPEVAEIERRWREEADTERVFNGQIANLASRVLEASEEDRPGYERLAESLEVFAEGDYEDDDAAEEVIFCLQDITSRDSLRVVEDGSGGHLRAFDGKPGHTCPDCGNGYATSEALLTHREQDCDSAIDAEDADRDADAHDALHSAAESYASVVNNSGMAAQIEFLRAAGWSYTDIENTLSASLASNGVESLEEALDDVVIDTASQAASDGYNDGIETADAVSHIDQTLDARRATNPSDGSHYEWGASINQFDPLAGYVAASRITRPDLRQAFLAETGGQPAGGWSSVNRVLASVGVNYVHDDPSAYYAVAMAAGFHPNDLGLNRKQAADPTIPFRNDGEGWSA